MRGFQSRPTEQLTTRDFFVEPGITANSGGGNTEQSLRITLEQWLNELMNALAGSRRFDRIERKGQDFHSESTTTPPVPVRIAVRIFLHPRGSHLKALLRYCE